MSPLWAEESATTVSTASVTQVSNFSPAAAARFYAVAAGDVGSGVQVYGALEHSDRWVVQVIGEPGGVDEKIAS